MAKRFFIVVLDSVGIGALPDAANFGDGDVQANTLAHVAQATGLRLPVMERLGLANIADLPGMKSRVCPQAAWGKMASQAKGMDTTSGHWEMAGLILDSPLPTFPQGFPTSLMETLSAAWGREVLGNCVASGTEIIARLGQAHMESGKLIVYTSADSVLQIAAHEETVPLEELYRDCQLARDILQGPYGVGRVIARPFVGRPGAFVRTDNRRDFSLQPPAGGLLAKVRAAGKTVVSIGKIEDIFAGQDIDLALPGHNNGQSVDSLKQALRQVEEGLIFANLVEFDSKYGHRNDPQGYAQALADFDQALPALLDLLRPEDIFAITADHGNDPCSPGTDHNREYVPLLLCGPRVKPVHLGVRATFADLGQTAAAYLGGAALRCGESFLTEIL
ncbi:MAG: phosphopentomutase [Firmicutes bacterium]|nr:phosphopentomutase [Bacillota bacterium]